MAWQDGGHQDRVAAELARSHIARDGLLELAEWAAAQVHHRTRGRRGGQLHCQSGGVGPLRAGRNVKA